MNKERFEEIIENLKLEREKWLTLTEIDSIVLNDGRGIYPNWVHMRFLITKENNIVIKHGSSEPYGTRFANRFSISPDCISLAFPPEAVISEIYYGGQFRLPREGDIIRSTVGCFKVLSESMITKVYNTANTFYIDVTNPIKIKPDSHLSFYDPKEFNQDSCVHASEVEGIYLKFQENNGKNKKYGVQHETIKVKQIKEINLKLSKLNKTYKLT